MREIRADWEKFGQIRRSPCAGGRCFLAIIRVYFIASAIFLRNCLVPSHAQERPATHAAAGAAARGVRRIGGLFHTLGSGSTRGFNFFVLRRFFHTVEAEIAGGG